MKMNIKNIFSAVAAASMLTACVGDLNTIPLNPTDVTSETAYGADELGYVQGLTKIYISSLVRDKGLIIESLFVYQPFLGLKVFLL